MLIFSEADIYRFTKGDCHHLARALNSLDPALQIYCFWTNPHCGIPDLHAFVRVSRNKYLDIEGLQTVKQLIQKYDGNRDYGLARKNIRPVEWSLLRSNFNSDNGPKHGHYTYQRAREVARILYDYYVKG